MKAGIIQFFGALLVLLAKGDLFADPLSNWNWCYPIPQGRALYAVAYGGGQFIAVGDSGTIVNSGDGYHWTNQVSGVTSPLRGVAYADGEFAAVGDGGIVLLSTNGIGWSQVPALTANSLLGIAGDSSWRADGGPQFLAVGYAGVALQCVNDLQWSPTPSGTTNTLNSVAYFDSDYIAVGANGVVDLYLGSFAPVPESQTGITNNLNGVDALQSGGVFAVGDLSVPSVSSYQNGVLFSPDFGYDLWTNENVQGSVWFPSQLFTLHSICNGSNGFVAVGDTGNTLEFNYPGVVISSQDGVNWSEQPAGSSEYSLYGCCYGRGLYVLVGDAGGIVVSPNLVDWTEISGNHRSAITAEASLPRLSVANALPIFREYSSFPDFTTLISTNGTNWSVTSTTAPAIAQMASANGVFVGVGPGGFYSTVNGLGWQTNGSAPNSLFGVCCAKNQFIAVGGNGGIFQSTNGINWLDRSISVPGDLSCVAYGNGIYVASGSFTATSRDGASWAVCATNIPTIMTKLVYGEGLFVAIAYNGFNNNGNYLDSGLGCPQILTSHDGTNWQNQLNLPVDGFSGIAYTGGRFLAITMYGLIYSSADGTNWQKIAFSLPLDDNDSFQIYYPLDILSVYGTKLLSGVYPDNGAFLAAGIDGILIRSQNTWEPPVVNAAHAANNGVQISFMGQMDVPYQIQTSTNLVNWYSLEYGTGSGQTTNIILAVSPGDVEHFFRVIFP